MMNCHGCKWLDETYKGPPGTGYCYHVQQSAFYHDMDCVIDCGRRAPEIRKPENKRCELYEAGDFATRYDPQPEGGAD